MDKTKKNVPEVMEKLAEIADMVQNLYEGRATVVFELEKQEFKKTQNHFREIDRHHKQFKIDISGTEFIYLLQEDDDEDES